MGIRKKNGRKGKGKNGENVFGVIEHEKSKFQRRGLNRDAYPCVVLTPTKASSQFSPS